MRKAEEIAALKESGKRLAFIVSELAKMAKPGVSSLELDAKARELAAAAGGTPSFLNYKPAGARRPYPAAVCVSVNDVIVHGIPNEKPKTFCEGDIVGIDMGLTWGGFVTDVSVTVPVGSVDGEAVKLVNAAKEALQVGIEAAKPGVNVNDIGKAIERFVKPTGFSIAEELGGHGVGRKVHEEPFVPNFTIQGKGAKLVPGMVIAIEPMLNEGTGRVVFDPDGYTVRTGDGKRSAHFEHTVIITENGSEIITKE